MKAEGHQDFSAGRERVWAMLMDPRVLERALPGCEKLEPDGDHSYRASIKMGLAAVRGAYSGQVRMSDLNPPESYSLILEGKGSPGFVRGTARIRLSEQGDATLLSYEGEIQVGGLIAAIGQRMLQGMASTLLNQFFQNLQKEIGAAPLNSDS